MAKARPLCKVCQKRPRLVNYVKDGVRFYRARCLACEKERRQSKTAEGQALLKSGYQKTPKCDRCGFHAKHSAQLSIVYLDGNRLNVNRTNLRTYCLNCIAELSAMPAKRSGPVADF